MTALRLLLALALPALAKEAPAPRLDGSTPAERGTALVAHVSTCRPSANDETYPKASAPAYAARLLLGTDTACALEEWRGYGAMNYRLMMDGAGYLAAEEWPDLTDAGGLDAAAIRKATGERLSGYFERITRGNFDEYGCPIYLAVDLSAVRMLAEFARSPEMRKRATLTLDAMMLDIACSWTQCLHAGTAARAKYWGSTDTGLESMGATAAAAWVWFDAPRSIAASGTGWILETSEPGPFAGGGPEAELDHFAAAILGRAKVDASGLDQQPPRLRFTSLGGHQLDLTWLPHKQVYAGQAKIDGQPVDYPSWPLHGNPWVRQHPGNPALELTHGKDRLSYDFARWSRRAWRDDGP
jgi:hypothetical protein